ncbi:hypothetical protein BJ741DRAFT_155971 [Chytriomyces cf. hyalinus JEL632]|nr:hypothetical protein BJ741DRAFT_155971 [Chytriomyces cf. hyalinus JEL632]
MSLGGLGSNNANSLAHAWATGNFGSDGADTQSIAVSHLKKLGWKSGEGLGKKKDGINRAISVGFKNDTRGVGAAKDQFDFSWWDHVFNKASSQIQIHKEESGEIQVKVERNSAKQKQLLYGSFVKVQEEEDDDEKDFSIKVTDEELFIACEGRTARKGARAEQPGKLNRVVKDRVDVPDLDEDAAEDESKSIKKAKKDKKKRKMEEEREEGASEESESKKKKSGDKKEKKEKKDKKDKKDKKKRSRDTEDVHADESTKPDPKSDKVKKRKAKEVQESEPADKEADDSSEVAAVAENETTAELKVKKSKKSKKLSKETPDESSDDSKQTDGENRKRKKRSEKDQ